MKSIRHAIHLTAWCLAGFASATFAAGGGVAQKCLTDAKFLCANISVANDVVSIDPEPLSESPVVTRVIWTLPEGYVFVPNDDGVAFKHAQGQFDRGDGIDANGSASPNAKARFRWTVKRWHGPSLQFTYSISFHEKNGASLGRQFVCDPTIVNTAALTARVKQTGGASAEAPLKCTVK